MPLVGRYDRLTGTTAGAGSTQVTRAWRFPASLEPSARRRAQRDRADAEWRAQVEQMLRELGYEETPGARREMREPSPAAMRPGGFRAVRTPRCAGRRPRPRASSTSPLTQV